MFITVQIIIAGNLKQPRFLFANGFSPKNRTSVSNIRIRGLIQELRSLETVV